MPVAKPGPGQTLKALRLKNNRLGPKTGKALGAGLLLNSSLIELDVTYNYAGDTLGIPIARALGENTGLQILRIGDNDLEEPAGAALVESLKTNRALRSL